MVAPMMSASEGLPLYCQLGSVLFPLTSMVRKLSVVMVWYTPLDSALANKSLVGHWHKRRETDVGKGGGGGGVMRREGGGRRMGTGG